MRRMLLAACLLAASAAGGCMRQDGAAVAGDPRAPDPRDFDAWRARDGHAARAEAYLAFLERGGAGGVLSARSLLVTGRHWRRCGAEPYAVPPRGAWPAMPPTLHLVRDLRAAGLLRDASVASVFRDPAFNRCEGGAPNSRHVSNRAVDFDLGAEADVAALCAFWRRHGPALAFGLGFYDRRRIHVDTAGFRTWGLDYTRASSWCVAGGARRPPP